MNKRRKAAAVLCMLITYPFCLHAADDSLSNYQLDALVVEEDAAKDQFGNVVTEQSYYRTGGDVNVVTREDIEKHHYADISEAIKSIPGVAFANFGYKGGEYGYAYYNNSFSIRGLCSKCG